MIQSVSRDSVSKKKKPNFFTQYSRGFVTLFKVVYASIESTGSKGSFINFWPAVVSGSGCEHNAYYHLLSEYGKRVSKGLFVHPVNYKATLAFISSQTSGHLVDTIFTLLLALFVVSTNPRWKYLAFLAAKCSTMLANY